MLKNLKESSFKYDEEKLEELLLKKNELTLKIDLLAAEHKFLTGILKNITDEYFKVLGVKEDE